MRVLVRIVALVLALASLGGCYRPLFQDGDTRTQFDAYDRVRNRYTPLEERDVFGKPIPALRARLTQSE